MPSFGEINWAMLVHGEQSIEVFGPIPADGTVESTTRIVGIYDKGSGALAVMETESKYKDSGKPAFNTRFGAFIRGEGGFGDSRGDALPERPKIPERAPDHEVTYGDATTRRCSTASPATATRCTPTRRSPSSPASTGRSCTACARTAFTGRRCCTSCAAPTSRSSRAWTRVSRSPSCPATTLTVRMWDDGKGRALFQTATQDGTVVIDGGVFGYK